MSRDAGTIAMSGTSGHLTGDEVLPRSEASVAGETVGGQAARGAVWTLVFSILGKCATLGCQIGLAWFLTPEHFGLASLALSVTALTSITSGTNLRNILIQRRACFEAEAGQVFWLSLSLSAGAGLLLAASASAVARVFNEPRIVPLLYLLAIAAPFQSLPTIYSAALGRGLRFRDTGGIHLIGAIVQSLMAVFLAWRGFEVYSLILPVLAVAVVMAVAYRITAGKIPIEAPRPFRWGAMLSPMTWLMANSLLVILQTYGVNLVIVSVEKNITTAGYYAWGYAVASQAVFLLATNLQGVLFPVLSRLQHEPDRQYDAFRQSCRTLLALVVPLCLAQVIFAPKIIPLIFQDRWSDAVPVVQWLSAGLCLQPLATLTTSLLLARGDYRTLAALNGAFACCIPIAAWIGTLLGHQHEIAICVGTCLLMLNLVSGVVAAHVIGRPFHELAPSIALPVFVGVAAAGGTWWFGRLLGPGSSLRDIILPALAGTMLYFALMRALLPQVISGVIVRFRHRAISPQSAGLNAKASLSA